MNDLHIVASYPTYGCLKNAVQNHLLEGEVWCMNEIPAIGPLQNMDERTEFWKKINEIELFSDPDQVNKEMDDYFFAAARWKDLNEYLKNSDDHPVVWIGNTNNDYIFLRMCCYYIKGLQSLSYVRCPLHQESLAIEIYPPQKLAPMIKDAVRLSVEEKSSRAEEFVSIASHSEELRELNEQGELQFFDVAHYDDLMLRYSSTQWQNCIVIVTAVLDDYYKKQKRVNYTVFDQFCFFRINEMIKNGILEKRDNGSKMEIRLKL